MANYFITFSKDLENTDIILNDNATYLLNVIPTISGFNGTVNFTYTWYKNRDIISEATTSSLLVKENVLGSDSSYFVEVSVRPENNVGNTYLTNNSFTNGISSVTSFSVLGVYLDPYFYNRDSSIKSDFIYVENLLSFKPIYGSSVSYSSRINTLETVDNAIKIIPSSENNLTIKYKLKFLFPDDDLDILNVKQNTAGNLLKTIEAAGAHKVLKFYDPSHFYTYIIGYVEEYSINKPSKTLTQIELTLSSYFKVPLLNWSSSKLVDLNNYLDREEDYLESFGKPFNKTRKYKKHDFVRITEDTISNKIDTFWFAKEDVEANSEFNYNSWSRDFIFETKLPFITENKIDIKQLIYKNSFIQNVKFKNNANSIKSYNLKFENITSLEAKAIIFFLEKKSGYRRFKYDFPFFFKKEKVFICPQWDHSINYYNSHTISMNFIEDPNGVIHRNDDVYPQIISESFYDKTIYARSGDYFSFSVVAKAQVPISYQWYKDDIAIPGATESSYYKGYVSNNDGGRYRVKLSILGLDDIFSTSGYITVLYEPRILRQPYVSKPAARYGFPFSLSVSVDLVDKLGPTTYQWRKNGTPISNATSATYSENFTQYSQLNDVYDVILTNKNGNFLTTTVNPTAIFGNTQKDEFKIYGDDNLNPYTTFVNYAGSFKIEGTFFSPPPNTVRIIKGIGRNTTTVIEETINSDYYSHTFTNIREDDADFYAIYLYNNNVMKLQMPTLFRVILKNNIYFTINPQSQTKILGSSVTFNALAEYNENAYTSIQYKWQKNGTDISGATSNSYTLNNISSIDAGLYTLKATPYYFSTAKTPLISEIAKLNILTVAPNIIYHPSPVVELKESCENFSSCNTFTMCAVGDCLTYKWRKNGIDISGATCESYTITGIKEIDDATYYGVVTDSSNRVICSSGSILKVHTPLQLICGFNEKNCYKIINNCQQIFNTCFSGRYVCNITLNILDNRLAGSTGVTLTEGFVTGYSNNSGRGSYTFTYNDSYCPSPYYTYIIKANNLFNEILSCHTVNQVEYKLFDTYISNNKNCYIATNSTGSFQQINNTNLTGLPVIKTSITLPITSTNQIDQISFIVSGKTISSLNCCPTEPILYTWRTGNNCNSLLNVACCNTLTPQNFVYRPQCFGNFYVNLYSCNYVCSSNISPVVSQYFSQIQEIKVIATPYIYQFKTGYTDYVTYCDNCFSFPMSDTGTVVTVVNCICTYNNTGITLSLVKNSAQILCCDIAVTGEIMQIPFNFCLYPDTYNTNSIYSIRAYNELKNKYTETNQLCLMAWKCLCFATSNTISNLDVFPNQCNGCYTLTLCCYEPYFKKYFFYNEYIPAFFYCPPTVKYTGSAFCDQRWWQGRIINNTRVPCCLSGNIKTCYATGNPKYCFMPSSFAPSAFSYPSKQTHFLCWQNGPCTNTSFTCFTTTHYPLEGNCWTNFVGCIELYQNTLTFCVCGPGWPFYFFLYKCIGNKLSYHTSPPVAIDMYSGVAVIDNCLDPIRCFCGNAGFNTRAYYDGVCCFVLNYSSYSFTSNVGAKYKIYGFQNFHKKPRLRFRTLSFTYNQAIISRDDCYLDYNDNLDYVTNADGSRTRIIYDNDELGIGYY